MTTYRIYPSLTRPIRSLQRCARPCARTDARVVLQLIGAMKARLRFRPAYKRNKNDNVRSNRNLDDCPMGLDAPCHINLTENGQPIDVGSWFDSSNRFFGDSAP